jgi:hypothetical protein
LFSSGNVTVYCPRVHISLKSKGHGPEVEPYTSETMPVIPTAGLQPFIVPFKYFAFGGGELIDNDTITTVVVMNTPTIKPVMNDLFLIKLSNFNFMIFLLYVIPEYFSFGQK